MKNDLTSIETALELLRRGIWPVPIKPKSKASIGDDWELNTRQDRNVEGEQRWHTIGFAKGVLTVAHTAEESEPGEVISIISARRATPGERKLYEKENIE